MLAAIPSPSSGILKLGPISLHAYGVAIALGMTTAVWLSSRRWVRRGGHPDHVGKIAIWALPAGIIGARLYHVITDWASFAGRRAEMFKIWKGGLGIWGGVALGVFVGLVAAKRMGLPLRPMLEVVAPAIPLAQAIGRWGNWFNQELFGRPSDLPWAVEIARNKRGDEFTGFPTFHPTFLYESLWNLCVVGLVLWVERTFGSRLKPGRLFAVYVAGYSAGRLVIEQLRIDTATKLFGLRINTFTASGLLLLSLLVLATGIRRGDRSTTPSPTTAVAADEG
jgi:prolipoprotein diacylglyceryl transferase